MNWFCQRKGHPQHSGKWVKLDLAQLPRYYYSGWFSFSILELEGAWVLLSLHTYEFLQNCVVYLVNATRWQNGTCEIIIHVSPYQSNLSLMCMWTTVSYFLSQAAKHSQTWKHFVSHSWQPVLRWPRCQQSVSAECLDSTCPVIIVDEWVSRPGMWLRFTVFA